MVGHVTMKLGAAHSLNTDHVKSELKVGDAIYEGDVLETASSGHLHIRFIDNALISLRPSSRLSIDTYSYNPKKAGESFIRFNLEKGIVRSISGDGARSAKDKFRLNTPVAAIGVRGTDFFAVSNDEKVSAVVNEGAIVVAPFEMGCTMLSFGPCDSESHTLLTSSDSEFVEIDVRSSSLVKKSLESDAFMQGLQSQVISLAPDLNDEREASVSMSESFKADAQDNLLHESDLDNQTNELKARELVWGRWSNLNASSNSAILPAIDIKQSGLLPILTSKEFYLSRAPLVDALPEDGVYRFDFFAGQADYLRQGEVLPTSVNNGDLTVDLNKNMYTSWVEVDNSFIGKNTFLFSGNVTKDGILHSVQGNQLSFGAVSNGLTEAAYSFHQTFPNGDNLNGVTLWDLVNKQ